MCNVAIGMPGIPELLILGGVLILLFGARKLPELARAMGSSITQFKKGLHEPDPAEKLPSGSGASTGSPESSGPVTSGEGRREAGKE